MRMRFCGLIVAIVALFGMCASTASAATLLPHSNTAHHCVHHVTGVCGWKYHKKPKSKYETAKCKDAVLSYSRHSQGTCSHHHGVRYWFK